VRLVTRDLPGTGGLHKTVPEDFIVEEIPAYLPSGDGPHTFLSIEKHGLDTDEAVTRIAAALGVAARDVGVAGQKDRHALTRQWMSVPNIAPERALALTLDGISILEAVRHGNKLRTGHLRGNRFTLTLRGVVEDAVARARAIVEALVANGGLPNYFGPQRFGARGDNAERGKRLLLGGAAAKGNPKQNRFLVSAYQAALFNRALDARIDDGLLRTALVGDVLKKSDTGGLFVVDDAALADAQARLEGGVLVVTGPMFGHAMMAPPAGTPAAAREQAILDEEGITPAAFATLGKLAEGTRRPLLVPILDPEIRAGTEPKTLILSFGLPSGSYATTLLAEVTK
jgi:tRNA pseudouridine13 synthase